MNCGHSDVLGKIDLKSVKRRPARGVLGGAESVETFTDVDGSRLTITTYHPVDIGARSITIPAHFRPLAREAT